MTFEEKTTWVIGVVTLIVVGWYVSVVAGPIGEVPVEEIAYRRPLLIAFGAMIVLTILGTIATAIATAIGGAIGGAIRAEVAGRDPVDVAVADIDRTDERDAIIDARGDRAAYVVSSVLMVGALALVRAMEENMPTSPGESTMRVSQALPVQRVYLRLPWVES